MRTKDLIREAISLPVDERALIVDSLLRSFNAPQSAIDKEWAKEGEKRLSELRSGRVKSIPGEAVFKKIKRRFRK